MITNPQKKALIIGISDYTNLEQLDFCKYNPDGTGLYPIPTDICARFLSISPRPTEDELKTVLNPICYLGPDDHSMSALSHRGTCSDQIETRCYPGWRPKPEEPGSYRHDKKLEEEMVRMEKDVRHQLMQHIIDSREGIMNTNSTHYQYFENRKRLAKSLSTFNPLEMLASKN